MPTKKSENKKIPKKKVVKKKNLKKATNKKEQKNDAVHKQIVEAVARIPTMIVEESVQQPATPSRTQYPRQYHHQYAAQRRMMWVGVILITAVICGVWLLNVRISIGAAYDSGVETGLLQNTREDFNTLLEQLHPKDQTTVQDVVDDQLNTNADDIKDAVSQSISALIAAQVITTSTIQTTTSSTTAATSTIENNRSEE